MTDQTAAMVEITIDPLRKRIRIHRETLKQLHYPAYVQFLVNPEKSYMAVLGSDQPLRGGTANRLRIDPGQASHRPVHRALQLHSLGKPFPSLGGHEPGLQLPPIRGSGHGKQSGLFLSQTDTDNGSQEVSWKQRDLT